MIPFVPNDTSLVGRYYVLDHDDYTDVVVGPESKIPGMRGAVLSGLADPIIEPVILKVHAPPFIQEVNDGEDPVSGMKYLKEVLLVFVTDRAGNLYLVHWNSEGCFTEWKDVVRYRSDQFEKMKQKQLDIYNSVSERSGKDYLSRLAAYEDEKERKYQAGLKKVPLPAYSPKSRVIHDTALSRNAQVKKPSKFTPFR